MSLIILDPVDQTQLIAQRQATGLDRYDEVWEGVYLMSPLANNEHQTIATRLATCISIVIDIPRLGVVLAGSNVSDRVDDWKQNYICPDVAVYLKANPAQDRGTYWLGGPDFAVEVVSQYDRSREKLAIYATFNTREVLIVDRYPWALDLYRLNEAGTYDLVGRSTLDDPKILASVVLPLSFRLQPGDDRPAITIQHTDGQQNWSA